MYPYSYPAHILPPIYVAKAKNIFIYNQSAKADCNKIKKIHLSKNRMHNIAVGFSHYTKVFKFVKQFIVVGYSQLETKRILKRL